MWPSHQVLSQLHYLSDQRSGLPRAGPTEPAHLGGKPGQPRGLLGSSHPESEHLRLLRPGPPWTQATEGAGPIPPAQSQQLFTNRNQEKRSGCGKVAPGPQPPLPLHPQQPHPPLPMASSFLPQHRSPPPTAQPARLDNLPTPHGHPQAHKPWPVGPLLLFTPRTPTAWTGWSGPSHTGPAHLGLPEAHSHTSRFPFVLGKAPAPMAATTMPIPPEEGFLGHPEPPPEPRGTLGSWGLQTACFWTGGPRHSSPPAEFPLTLWAGVGHRPSGAQS
ncbi:unnamed protein product [Nyctereutes procyonoides]|uniref:(raccoon dog) hypothetical protein n=1 Tax=Nyctereutes procyonoides TaxID=34880 RepID=A0A811XYA6_NYCPR|nr:unnamed protein product [Nyctereutes procyonoides]